MLPPGPVQTSPPPSPSNPQATGSSSGEKAATGGKGGDKARRALKRLTKGMAFIKRMRDASKQQTAETEGMPEGQQEYVEHKATDQVFMHTNPALESFDAPYNQFSMPVLRSDERVPYMDPTLPASLDSYDEHEIQDGPLTDTELESMWSACWDAIMKGSDDTAENLTLKLLTSCRRGKLNGLTKTRHGYLGNLTLFHLAARTGCFKTVTLLIKAGIDPNIQTDTGETALDIARRQFKRRVVNLLINQEGILQLQAEGLPAQLVQGHAGQTRTPHAGNSTNVSVNSRRTDGPGSPTMSLQLPPQTIVQSNTEGAPRPLGGGMLPSNVPTSNISLPQLTADDARAGDVDRRIVSINRHNQALTDQTRALRSQLESQKQQIFNLQRHNELQTRKLAESRKTKGLSPIEELLAEAVASYSQKRIIEAIKSAGEIGLRADNPSLQRAERALARLFLKGKPLSIDMPPLQQATALYHLAHNLHNRPYMVHIVILYARFLEKTLWSHGSTENQNYIEHKIGDAKGMVAQIFEEMVTLVRSQSARHVESLPPGSESGLLGVAAQEERGVHSTNFVTMLLESFCKILPFPTEVHLVSDSKKILLFFEFDGHCFVLSSSKWQLWLRYILCSAAGYYKPEVFEQCRIAFTEMQERQKVRFRAPHVSFKMFLEQKFDIIADGSQLAAELRLSHFYKAFRQNSDDVMDPRGPWIGVEEWWKTHRLVGPKQVPAPGYVKNHLETVVWRYYGSYTYFELHALRSMNDRPGCFPSIGNDEGCCGCVSEQEYCVLELRHQGCCDCSPTSYALGFSTAGCVLAGLGILFFLGWSDRQGYFGDDYTTDSSSFRLKDLCDIKYDKNDGFNSSHGIQWIVCKGSTFQTVASVALVGGVICLGFGILGCLQTRGLIGLLECQRSYRYKRAADAFLGSPDSEKKTLGALEEEFQRRFGIFDEDLYQTDAKGDSELGQADGEETAVMDKQPSRDGKYIRESRAIERATNIQNMDVEMHMETLQNAARGQSRNA